jgi:hypothetical protein
MLQSTPANIVLPELDEPFCCVQALQSNDPSENQPAESPNDEGPAWVAVVPKAVLAHLTNH